MKRSFRTFLAFSLALAVASCGGEKGSNVVDHPDGDSLVNGDQVTFPELPGSGDTGDVGELPDAEEWDFGNSEDGLDLSVPEEVESDTNGGDPLACSKDSDCIGKTLELAPCEKPVCNKHLGQCVPGPRFPGEACDDNDECTLDTVCDADGQCLGRPRFCDDGNLCTTDQCKADKGCVFAPNDNVCDDGTGCTKNDRCEATLCVGEPGESCTCKDDDDCAIHDDDNLCNGKVSCVFGECMVPQSTVKVCSTVNDGPCAKTVCKAATGQCVQVIRENGRPCNDGDACTVGDLCKQGACIGSAPLSCDDGNPCTVDTCDPVTGCLQEYSLYPCDDGDGCTVNDHCMSGVCVPGSGNQCNSKACFPKWPLQCGDVDSWSTAGEGSTDNIKAYSCLEDKLPGDEYTYAFVAPYDGVATLTLTAADVAARVLILEGKGTGCDATNCRSASEGVLSFDMFEGQSYFIVVDSPLDGGVDYSLSLDCMPFDERHCGDGIDDDGDGLTDCEDADCQGDEACPEALCVPIWTVGCGSIDFGSNYGIGATSGIVNYFSLKDNKGCLDNQWEYTGPEFAYRFDAPGDFNVTVRLLGETSQTDLLVLQDKGNGCDPTDCVAWGLKKVSFPAKAGETYYFVIDGYAASQGAFTIEVECPNFVETSCNDGLDNDLDTLTDCEDPDCTGAVECVGYCLPAKTVGCGFEEAFANFGWGSTDALEDYACNQWAYDGPEMAYRFKTSVPTSVQVKLLLENASTDILVVEGALCDPAKCLATGLDKVSFQAEAGKDYNLIVDGYQGALGTYRIQVACTTESETVCGDGVDNDGDGLVDCQDVEDCSGTLACPACKALYALECGDTDEWTTAAEETTDAIGSYACTPGQYDGPEFAYTFVAESTGPVSLLLQSTLWDLDLLVLEDQGSGCNPTHCLAWGTNQVDFDGVAGSKYYIVVDGYGKAPAGFGPSYGIGDYTLTVNCL